jgi:2-polyprenyl-6-methoxyphenol hydroxylase-like FAD-dependent oxidoreductase
LCRVVLQRDDIDQTTQPVKLNTIELAVEVRAEQFMNPDLFIACCGPAGLATAIVTQGGLSIVFSDAAPPPIDKDCGVGLSPDALEAFPYLGVDFSFIRSFPHHGIRFFRTAANPRTSFPHDVGLGRRRTILQSLLLCHAETAGSRFLWNKTFRGIQATFVAAVKHD